MSVLQWCADNIGLLSLGFSLVSAIIGIIALFISVHQTKLSNKQALFSRRLNVYLKFDGMVKLFQQNKQLILSDKNHDELPYIGVDLYFVWLTNNAFLESVTEAMQHLLQQPYHKDFLAKREEIAMLAKEACFVFPKKIGNEMGDFLFTYSELLFKMYQYEICVDSMRKQAEKECCPVEKNDMEVKLRNEYFDLVLQLDSILSMMEKDNMLRKIKKQIKL